VEHHTVLDTLLRDAARALTACRVAMPFEGDMEGALADAKAAQARGYYTPVEDERLRTAYVNYLGVRAALWETIQSLLPYIELPRQFKQGDWEKHLQAFGIAFTCAAMLLRSGYYLIDMTDGRPVVRDKLDEAEPRYNIKRKQFTEIYDSLVSTTRMMRFRKAVSFYQRHEAEIYPALLGGQFDKVVEILKGEDPYIQTKYRKHLKRKAGYNLFSLRRRHLSAVSKTMFFLFQSLGSDIAELKQPLVKRRGVGKRITDEVRAKLMALVRPGDVFVTRHDDAMSNLFLPGFWPHAALYIGSDKDRAAIGVEASNPDHQSTPGEVRFLESKKDGVLVRPAEDTLQVDACVILRPKISAKDLSSALTRALSHSGKLYDFVFDFASADRLACTELIYRTYTGFGGIDLKLIERAGRNCLSAEDLLTQGLKHNWFEVVAIFGVGNDLLNRGDKARKILIESYDYQPACP